MFMCRSSVNFTASASNGSPSWNFTFGRSLIVTVFPSSDVSCESASCGTMLSLRVDVEQLVAHRGEHDAPDIRARGGRIEIVGILGKTDAQIALRGGGDAAVIATANKAPSTMCASLHDDLPKTNWRYAASARCSVSATAAAMPASITSRSSVPCGFCRDGMNFT